MLPFTANEQVLYSAIPEMHSRHRRFAIYAALDCQENRSVIKAIIYRPWLETLMITVLCPDKTVENNNPLFSFSPPVLREHKVHFTYLSICHYADYGGTYLPECPWTTALNNYEDYVQCGEFAIQSDFPSSQRQLLRTDKVDPEYVFLYFLETFCGLVCII